MGKVLVVDEDVQIRKLIRQMLEPNGYDVTEISSNQKGIDLFRQNPTDVVIIDSLLSQKEAIEIIIELKRVSFDVAIIFISRENEAIDGEKLLAFAKPFGAVGTLTKPFKQNDLLDAIECASKAKEKYQEERHRHENSCN